MKLILSLIVTLFSVLYIHTAYCHTPNPAMDFLLKNNHYKQQAISITDKIASHTHSAGSTNHEGIAFAKNTAKAFADSLGFSEQQYSAAGTSHEEIVTLSDEIYRSYLGLIANQKNNKRLESEGKKPYPIIKLLTESLRENLLDRRRKLKAILSRLHR